MIEKLKQLGFKAEPHPQPKRILIKVQLGTVVITKLKSYYHVMIDVHGGTWAKNCETQEDVISYLDSEFMRDGDGKASTFKEIFSF